MRNKLFSPCWRVCGRRLRRDGRRRREWLGDGNAEVSCGSWSALFFALAPGMVAGVVPWWLIGWRSGASYPAPLQAAGIVMVAIGAAVLIHAFVRFVRE